MITFDDVRLVDVHQVAKLWGRSISWVWAEVKAGRIPAPVKLSHKCTRWRESVIAEHLAARIAAAEALQACKGTTQRE
jgi:prophage regulatory protein